MREVKVESRSLIHKGDSIVCVARVIGFGFGDLFYGYHKTTRTPLALRINKYYDKVSFVKLFSECGGQGIDQIGGDQRGLTDLAGGVVGGFAVDVYRFYGGVQGG